MPKTLEPHDLVVSKLSRFHAKDQEDIQILCDTGVVIADTLRERAESAFWMHEEGDPKRERAYASLERVVAYLEGTNRSV